MCNLLGHESWNYAFVDYDSELEVTSPFMGTLWQSKVPISHRLHESPISYAAVESMPVVVDEVAFASTVVSGVGTSYIVHGEPLLGVIRICYNIALNSESPINLATLKAMLTQMINIVFKRMESDQVPISSSSGPGHREPSSASSMQPNNREISMDEQEEKKHITLGDALSMNREKGTSAASNEELQNLAGGTDIKLSEKLAMLSKAYFVQGL
ncbi:hypothetical protein J5N97_013774 [Dioscorea zingiberensis]|uniref:Mon2/Sec7/BIG1-like dimerisation and cyclophilin-binding domain-containing protein n=1 Tax=Dioscorea zingiberensis TaxID=325984 RepID=A0A9D5HIY0_9LILI|nr:hypothetical protein J5N97_013774 [Dioscorea zingiberensis]